MPNAAARAPRPVDIESHRAYLVHYALAKLRGRDEAEEVVQEALVAALESLPDFRGDSSLRTWLTSILRFKIADYQRRAVRERQVFETGPDDGPDGDESWLDAQFDDTGHWRESPKAWLDPQAALEQRHFWEAFERCLGKLPPAAARVFFQREVIGEETKAICESEGITEGNCWVVLHRARNSLRSCLEANWFGLGASGGR
jgi:RNA polymerase sigma-70 factor (ECF subfamily)